MLAPMAATDGNMWHWLEMTTPVQQAQSTQIPPGLRGRVPTFRKLTRLSVGHCCSITRTVIVAPESGLAGGRAGFCFRPRPGTEDKKRHRNDIAQPCIMHGHVRLSCEAEAAASGAMVLNRKRKISRRVCE